MGSVTTCKQGHQGAHCPVITVTPESTRKTTFELAIFFPWEMNKTPSNPQIWTAVFPVSKWSMCRVHGLICSEANNHVASAATSLKVQRHFLDRQKINSDSLGYEVCVGWRQWGVEALFTILTLTCCIQTMILDHETLLVSWGPGLFNQANV